MDAIKGWVRNGRIETDRPVAFPEGTELRISPAGAGEENDSWDNTPEGIREWLAWYESLEPLILTTQEREQLDRERKEQRAWEFAHSDERAAKLRSL